MELIYQPLLNLLVVFYHLFFDNLGIAIVVFTMFIRLVLLPLTLPSMKVAKLMKEAAPDIERLKKKYAKDKTKLMQAQADYYREKGINPAAGCLPQILNIVILIALISGFNKVFQGEGDVTGKLNALLYPALHIDGELNTNFFGYNLLKPDVVGLSGLPFSLPGVFLVVVAALQFLSSKMMMPDVKVSEKVAETTKTTTDDFAASMQEQMLYMFPLVTLIVGYNFPLALVLYWGSLSLFQGIQQYFTSGWGGLAPYIRRIKRIA